MLISAWTDWGGFVRVGRLWVICAMTLLAGACTSATDEPVDEVSVGDSAAFCALWPEAKAALGAEFEARDEWELLSDVTEVRYTLDVADALVPAAVRAEWEAAIGFQDTVVTLLEIAGYQPQSVPQQLIDAAFGEGGAEAAASASALGIERVDAWAFDECGDFCELWPRLDRALGWGSSTVRHDEMEFHIIMKGAADEALIELADSLVPDEVRDEWDVAAGMKISMVDLYRSWAWMHSGEIVAWSEAERAWLDVFGLTDDEVGNYLEGHGGTEGLQIQPTWWVGTQISADHRAVIADWVGDNCEVVGTSGLSGTVRIEGPAGGPDRLLMAAVVPGTDLGAIGNASDFLGVACSDEQMTWDSWSTPLLTRNGDFDSPCTYRHMGHLVVTETLFPAGDYELFVGTFPVGFGDFDVYVPAPEECTVVPFSVDGDTVIALPDLEPCDLGVLAGTVEEIARRQPPPDPVGASGTLRVLLTEYFPDGFGYGAYRIVVLPGGTTLNDIGLGYAWPVGAGCMHYRPLNDEVDPRARLAITTNGVEVPVYAFPGTVDGGACDDALVYAGFEGERVGPDPIELAAGEYDVYLYRELGDEEGETRLCTTVSVLVSGDTVAEAPPLDEWGDC